jgi:hypothetical protein
MILTSLYLGCDLSATFGVFMPACRICAPADRRSSTRLLGASFIDTHDFWDGPKLGSN